MRKAQAGLDFLMTYGWALLLIVLVVGALFALGVFDVGSFTGTKAAGFSEVAPPQGGWQVTSAGALTMVLENHAGTDVNVTSITVTKGTDTVTYSTAFDLDNGDKSGTIAVGTLSSPGSQGSSYTLNVQVAYTVKDTGFQALSSGTVTGKVV